MVLGWLQRSQNLPRCLNADTQLVSSLRHQTVLRLGFVFSTGNICVSCLREPQVFLFLWVVQYTYMYLGVEHMPAELHRLMHNDLNQPQVTENFIYFIYLFFFRTFHSAEKRWFHPSASTQTTACSHLRCTRAWDRYLHQTQFGPAAWKGILVPMGWNDTARRDWETQGWGRWGELSTRQGPGCREMCLCFACGLMTTVPSKCPCNSAGRTGLFCITRICWSGKGYWLLQQ